MIGKIVVKYFEKFTVFSGYINMFIYQYLILGAILQICYSLCAGSTKNIHLHIILKMDYCYKSVLINDIYIDVFLFIKLRKLLLLV
jgi:hypothetical protein